MNRQPDSPRLPQVLVICGPTATGKTATALSVARRFRGEIISCDSRQVYRDMDIGTGKDLPPGVRKSSRSVRVTENNDVLFPYRISGVNLWLYDCAGFDEEMNVSRYTVLGTAVLADILKRRKLPVIVGGTGFYLKAIIDGIGTMDIPPDKALRLKLDSLSVTELQERLKMLDPDMLVSMNISDRVNRRRLLRRIEILSSGRIMGSESVVKPELDVLLIGLHTPDNNIMDETINRRVDDRISRGVLDEIGRLLAKGADWEMQSMTAIGYREWRDWFADGEKRSESKKQQIISLWKTHEHQYARRQLSWFRRDTRIRWVDITSPGWVRRVTDMTAAWYNFS